MKLSLVVLLSVLACSITAAQNGGGYYISRTVTHPGVEVTTDALGLPISLNHEDVKAIGMGKTQIGNGTRFNAMSYNPALLSRERWSLDLPGAQASIPAKSVRAISFLADNVNEFRTGNFIRRIKSGIRNLKNATTLDGQLAALREIQSGVRFAREVQDNVGSSKDDPRTHGFSFIPTLQAQVGNWGFSIYGTVQSGFQLFSGQAVTQLAPLSIPDRADQVTPELLLEILTAVEPLFDANGELVSNAYPEAYAVSYLDIAGSAGYSYELNEDLSVGALVKVANRRLSSKHVDKSQFDNILGEVSRDFRKSITGVTLDLGVLYAIRKTGTSIGVSLQNLIPVRKVSSTITVNTTVTGIEDYDRDNDGTPIVTNGDTALVGAKQDVHVNIPVELQAPLLANIGVMQPLTENWDVALDWVDIASRDDKFETYIERFRLGSEYRIDVAKIGIAFRAGVADKRGTLGLGFNFSRGVQIDGAYAFDSFIGENSYFAQVKIGW